MNITKALDRIHKCWVLLGAMTPLEPIRVAFLECSLLITGGLRSSPHGLL